MRRRIGRQVDVELREAGVRSSSGTELLVFVTREVEGLVPNDRSAAVDASLLLVERRDGTGVEARRVAERTEEMILTEKTESGPAHLVGARLGHRVDHGAVDASVFSVVAFRYDLELLDVLHAVALVRPAAALVGHVDPIHLILRHVAAGSAGLNRAGVPPRAGHQRDEPQPIAAVDRQSLHLAL